MSIRASLLDPCDSACQLRIPPTTERVPIVVDIVAGGDQSCAKTMMPGDLFGDETLPREVYRDPIEPLTIDKVRDAKHPHA